MSVINKPMPPVAESFRGKKSPAETAEFINRKGNFQLLVLDPPLNVAVGANAREAREEYRGKISVFLASLKEAALRTTIIVTGQAEPEAFAQKVTARFANLENATVAHMPGGSITKPSRLYAHILGMASQPNAAFAILGTPLEGVKQLKDDVRKIAGEIGKTVHILLFERLSL